MLLPDDPHLAAAATLPSSPSALAAARLLTDYFRGLAVDFASLLIDEQGLTPFQLRVYRALRQVGRGRLVSYGSLARACGVPAAARAVGGAVGANPLPVVIPCHRVVAAHGKLGGFSAPGGVVCKRWLLELEGVVVSSRGSVVTVR